MDHHAAALKFVRRAGRNFGRSLHFFRSRQSTVAVLSFALCSGTDIRTASLRNTVCLYREELKPLAAIAVTCKALGEQDGAQWSMQMIHQSPGGELQPQTLESGNRGTSWSGR